MPERIQLSRKKGWRMPPNTVKVTRPSKWGNPVRLQIEDGLPGADEERRESVRFYQEWLFRRTRQPSFFGEPPRITEVIAELRGKNLACWCRLDQPCHADVLLELANRPACDDPATRPQTREG